MSENLEKFLNYLMPIAFIILASMTPVIVYYMRALIKALIPGEDSMLETKILASFDAAVMKVMPEVEAAKKAAVKPNGEVVPLTQAQKDAFKEKAIDIAANILNEDGRDLFDYVTREMAEGMVESALAFLRDGRK